MWRRGRRTRKKPKSKTKLCFSFRDRKEREAATRPPATSGQQPQTAHPHRDPKGLLECWRRPSAETEVIETQPRAPSKEQKPARSRPAASVGAHSPAARIEASASAERAELRWRPPSGRVQQALRSAPGRLLQGHGPSARQIRLLQSPQSEEKERSLAMHLEFAPESLEDF